MKNAIITGTTGMIGGIILRKCLSSPEISHVTSIVRRSSDVHHPKLTEIVINDFMDYQEQKHIFSDQHVAYYCLGVYTGQVDKNEFYKITVDYTKSFADNLKSYSPHCTFCFLSGSGADPTGSSKMMFAKDKGIAEKYLMQCDFTKTYIFRPAYIYPVDKRKEPNFFYRLVRFLYPVLKIIYPAGAITSEHLGAAMFQAGIHGAPNTILENEQIKQIVTQPYTRN